MMPYPGRPSKSGLSPKYALVLPYFGQNPILVTTDLPILGHVNRLPDQIAYNASSAGNSSAC